MMRDDLIDLDPVVQALRDREWDTSIDVEITRVQEPVESFRGNELFANGRMFAQATVLEAMVTEIEYDLNRLKNEYPEVTNYRIGLYQCYDNIVRFSRHYYTA